MYEVNKPSMLRWRRWLRWTWRTVMVLVLVIVLLLAAYITWANVAGDRAAKRVLDAIAARSLEPDLSYLGRQDDHPQTTASARAGRYFAAAMELSRIGNTSVNVPVVGQEALPPFGAAIDPDTAERMAKFLADYEVCFVMLDKVFTDAPIDPRIKYHPTDFESVLRDISGLRPLARLLMVRSLLHQARNEPDDALSALELAFDMILSYAHQPSTTVHLVLSSLDAMIQENLQGALGRTTPSIEALRSLHGKLISLAETDTFSEQMKFEIACAAHAMTNPWLEQAANVYRVEQYLEADPFAEVRKFLEQMDAQVPDNSLFQQTNPDRARRFMTLARVWLTVCPGAYRLMKAKTIEQMLADYHQYVLDGHDALALYDSEWDNGRYVPSAYRTMMMHRVRLVITATAVAVEIYRAEHGQWPASLHDCPGALDDPLIGKPLTIERTNTGCRIFSDKLYEDERSDDDLESYEFLLLDVDRRGKE